MNNKEQRKMFSKAFPFLRKSISRIRKLIKTTTTIKNKENLKFLRNSISTVYDDSLVWHYDADEIITQCVNNIIKMIDFRRENLDVIEELINNNSYLEVIEYMNEMKLIIFKIDSFRY